jgi:hypothetical protein
MLLGYASQTARHGTLLKASSAPTADAALPVACCIGSEWIPLGRCHADRDSGRIKDRSSFIRKMRSFEEPHTPPEVRRASFVLMLVKQGPSKRTAGKSWGSVFKSGIG